MARKSKRVAPPAPQRHAPSWIAPLAVFGTALLLRLIAAAQLRDLPLFRTPQLDSREYLDWARVVAAGDFTWPAALPHGPGYPFFLSALLRFFGPDSLGAVRTVQALIGAGSALLVFLLARRFFGAAAGLAAGLLIAAYAPLISIDVSILGEGLLIALLLASVWLALRETRLSAALAGLALGCAAIVRPTALVIALVVGWILVRRRDWIAVATAAGVLLIPILPVTIANYRANQKLIPIQAHGGLNFYQGNSPSGSGTPSVRPGGPWNRFKYEARRAGAKDSDAYFMNKARTEIRSAPLRYAALLAKKAARVVQSDEIRDSHSFYFFADHSSVLKVGVRFAVLFPLFVYGVFVSRRRGLPLLACVALFALTLVALMIGSRYRMPMIPFMAPFAGLAIIELLQTRDRRRLAIAAAIFVVAVVASHVLPHPESHQFAEEWDLTGSALLREQDLGGAAAAFENALREDPTRAHAWAGRGAVELASRDLRSAKTSLERAIALDPYEAFAHSQLSAVHEQMGDLAAAAESARVAFDADPEVILGGSRYAELLVRQQRIAEAAQVYERILATLAGGTVVVAPDQLASFHLRHAELLGALGRPADGVRAARKATEVEPSNGRAWVLLALLAADAGDLTTARSALGRAEMLLPAGAQELQIARGRVGSEP